VDWHSWHEKYGDPDSALSHRLRAIQAQVNAALDRAPAGPLRAISLCAGQGRDLIEPLRTHPRGGDVSALLVELDGRNAEIARRNSTDLPRVDVITGDAADLARCAEMAPADLVLFCGIFGNVSDTDIERTIDHCDQLAKTGATVIWTRHRKDPDLVPQLCEWFEARGFERLWVAPREAMIGAGAHRFAGAPKPLDRAAHLFDFVGA
jgi:hypothetical protein